MKAGPLPGRLFCYCVEEEEGEAGRHITAWPAGDGMKLPNRLPPPSILKKKSPWASTLNAPAAAQAALARTCACAVKNVVAAPRPPASAASPAPASPSQEKAAREWAALDRGGWWGLRLQKGSEALQPPTAAARTVSPQAPPATDRHRPPATDHPLSTSPASLPSFPCTSHRCEEGCDCGLACTCCAGCVLVAWAGVLGGGAVGGLSGDASAAPLAAAVL